MIFIYILLSILSSWLTYYLIKQTHLTPTRVSSGLSLVFIFFIYILSEYININFIFVSSLVFGASFVGMCSHKLIGQRQVVFAGLLFLCFYIYLFPLIKIFGGALGFSAFCSILVVKIIGDNFFRNSKYHKIFK